MHIHVCMSIRTCICIMHMWLCTPMRFLPASIHVLETTSMQHQLELYSWLSGAWLSVLVFLWLCFCCAVKGAFYKLTTSGSARVLERCSHRIFGREFWVPWTQKVKPKVESAKTEKTNLQDVEVMKKSCKQHQAIATSLDRWGKHSKGDKIGFISIGHMEYIYIYL